MREGAALCEAHGEALAEEAAEAEAVGEALPRAEPLGEAVAAAEGEQGGCAASPPSWQEDAQLHGVGAPEPSGQKEPTGHATAVALVLPAGQ